MEFFFSRDRFRSSIRRHRFGAKYTIQLIDPDGAQIDPFTFSHLRRLIEEGGKGEVVQ